MSGEASPHQIPQIRYHTRGKVHYSIVVDCLFLAVFVCLHGGPQGREYQWWHSRGNGDALWKVLRFLNIPKHVFTHLLEAVGMPARRRGRRRSVAVVTPRG